MREPTAAHDLLNAIPADSLDTRVANEIREKILGGEWGDGTRIIEVAVAEQLNVSRGPVRVALAKLVEEGLVENVPRRGAYVRWVPAEDLEEIVLIRGSIESVALRLAMSRSPGHLRDEAESAVALMRTAVGAEGRERSLEGEIRFHDAIYHASASRRLVQMWSHIRPTVTSSFRNDRAFYTSPDQVVASHELLLSIIRVGDVRAALAELHSHIQPTRSRLPNEGPPELAEDAG